MEAAVEVEMQVSEAREEEAAFGPAPRLSALSCKGGKLVLDGPAAGPAVLAAPPAAPTSESGQLDASTLPPRFSCEGDRLMITSGAPPPPPRLLELASQITQVGARLPQP